MPSRLVKAKMKNPFSKRALQGLPNALDSREAMDSGNEKQSTVALAAYPSLAAKSDIDNFWAGHISRAISNAHELPFNLTPKQLEQLNEYVTPLVVKASSSNTYSNSHVMQATLLVLCEKFLSTKGTGLRRIEVGANYRTIAAEPNKHFCSLTTGRDQARIISTICESGLTQNSVDELSRLYHDIGCTHGVQNCNHPADVLIGNNVCYDISMTNLYKAFKNHGARAGYFSLLIPDELFSGLSGRNNKWHYSVYKKGSSTSMFFDDFSWGYTHETKDWTDWALTDVYEGDDFNLTFERTREFGNMWCVRVTRVEKSLKIMHKLHSPLLNGMTRIYNFLPYLTDISDRLKTKSGFRSLFVNKRYLNKIKNEAQFWYVPTEIVSRVAAFLWNRKDAEIDRHNAGMMTVASTQRITISQYSIQHGFIILDRDFGPLSMNIFIRALVSRAMSTKETGSFIKNIQQISHKDTRWSTTFKQIFRSCNPFDDPHARNELKVYGVTKEHMLVYTFLLGNEEPEQIVYSAAAGHGKHAKLDAGFSKVFTVDPWEEPGFCADTCFKALTGDTLLRPLGPDPLDTDIENLLNTEGYTIKKAPNMDHLEWDIQNNHAKVIGSTNSMCKHGLAFELLPLKDRKHFDLAKVPYDVDGEYYAHDDKINTNAIKTKWCLDWYLEAEDFYDGSVEKKLISLIPIRALREKARDIYSTSDKIRPQIDVAESYDSYGRKTLYATGTRAGKIVNMCAAPFNDFEVWQKVQNVEVIHNIVNTDGVTNFVLPTLTVNHSSVCQKNAACVECVKTFDCDLYMADVGNNVSLERLPSFTNKVLLVSLIHKQETVVIIKIRRFVDMLKDGNCGSMVDTIKNFYNVYHFKGCSPGEVFAVRRIDYSKRGSQFHRHLTTNFCLQIEERKTPIKTVATSAAEELLMVANLVTIEPIDSPWLSPFIPKKFEVELAETSEDVYTELYCPDLEYSLLDEPSAPPAEEKEEEVITGDILLSEYRMKQHTFMVGIQEAEKVRSEIVNIKPEFAGKVHAIGRLFAPTMPATSLKDVKLEDAGGVCLKDCTIAEAIHMSQFFIRTEYLGDHMGKTFFRNDGLFDTFLMEEKYEAPLFVTPFHPSAAGFRNILEQDAKLPPVICILRSDIPNINFPIPKTTEVFQLVDDFNDCKGCQIDTFDGFVTGVKNNTIFGPKRKLEPMPFTEVTIRQDPKILEEERRTYMRELMSEKGKFEKLHNEVGKIVEDTPWISERKVKIVEGTYGSGKTTMAKQLLKGQFDIAICPNGALAAEYVKDKFSGYSWSTGTLVTRGQKVLIDEAFCMEKRALQQILSDAAEVWMIGDRDQTKGGGKDCKSKLADLRDQVPLSMIKKRMTSITTPHDVVQANNKKWGMNVKSLSRVINSVRVTVVKGGRSNLPKVCPKKCADKHKHIYGACFDTTHADAVKYPTVATVQGLRTQHFNLFLSPNCGLLIDKVHGQHLVGTTRHTEVLEVLCDNAVMVNRLGVDKIPDHTCNGGIKVGRRDRWQTPYGPKSVVNGTYKIIENSKVNPFKMKVDGEVKKITGNDRLERLQQVSGGIKYEFSVPENYEVSQHRYGMPSLDVEIPVEETLDDIELEDERLMGDKSRATAGFSNAVGPVDAAMARIAPTSSEMANPNRRVQFTKLRAPLMQRKIKVRLGERPVFEESNQTGNVLSSRTYGMVQENSVNHLLHTVTERYGANKQLKMDDVAVSKYSDELIAGLDKFVDLSKLKTITPEEHSIEKLAALQKICAKGSYPGHELFGETYASTEKISGFNKAQLKAKIGEEAWLPFKTTEGVAHMKGGQPVSAQAKTINEIVGPYVQHMENQIFACARPGVFPGYGHAPALFRKQVRRRLEHVRKHHDAKFIEALSLDVTEQDTTKHAGKRRAIEKLFRDVGTPQEVIDCLQNPNIEWEFDNPFVSTNVKERFQSGRKDTLANNTIDTMMEVGRSYEWDSLKLYLGQGDDAHLRATNIRRTENWFESFKEDKNPIGDFISYIITDDDIYLDFPRIAAKLLSREYPDASRLEQIRQATYDLLSLHPSHQDRYNNQLVCAAKYGCALGDIFVIYEYLNSFATQREKTVTLSPQKGQGEVVKTLLAATIFK